MPEIRTFADVLDRLDHPENGLTFAVGGQTGLIVRDVVLVAEELPKTSSASCAGPRPRRCWPARSCGWSRPEVARAAPDRATG